MSNEEVRRQIRNRAAAGDTIAQGMLKLQTAYEANRARGLSHDAALIGAVAPTVTAPRGRYQTVTDPATGLRKIIRRA
jgi:hypothetical protein